MKKGLKNQLIFFGIILLVLILLFFPKGNSPETSKEISKCIGENSILYVQLGCHACETQEEMFGENYEYLTSVDCYFTPEKCAGITATPTWEIKGNKYIGVQSIEKLQELTGC